MEDDLLTVAEVAGRMGVTFHAVYGWIERGLLPSSIVLGVRAVKASDLAAFERPKVGGARPGAGRKKRQGGTDET